MPSKFPEAIFRQKIADLSFSESFKRSATSSGYHTLQELCEKPALTLFRDGVLNLESMMEFSAFMESKNLGHYIDEPLV